MDQKWAYGLWGAALGAGACMIIGFWPSGWQTSGGSARQAEAAVSAALLPVCVDAILANQMLSEIQFPSMGCNIKWKN